ncbi:HNH endonuclease [Streptomyces sp. NPDC101221]|uniref:HNH endonuclease n=1 Tax=Streptomyces sp. NPDC101221 TaxID=3366132 RepID=UPI0038155D70
MPCGQPGTEVDHIRPGSDHSLDNLQLLCHACHARKTHAESRAAWALKRIPPKAKGRPGTRSEPTPDVW